MGERENVCADSNSENFFSSLMSASFLEEMDTNVKECAVLSFRVESQREASNMYTQVYIHTQKLIKFSKLNIISGINKNEYVSWLKGGPSSFFTKISDS